MSEYDVIKGQRIDTVGWLLKRTKKTRTYPNGFRIAKPSTAELRRWLHAQDTPVPVRKLIYNILLHRRHRA